MRPVNFGPIPFKAPDDEYQRWIQDCLAEIRDASNDDLAAIANDFSLGTYTVTRTLDPSTATLADVANVLATFISDLRNRGGKRRQ